MIHPHGPQETLEGLSRPDDGVRGSWGPLFTVGSWWMRCLPVIVHSSRRFIWRLVSWQDTRGPSLMIGRLGAPSIPS